MSNLPATSAAVLFTVTATAVGCASQAGPGYQGEPLLRLDGTVINTLTTAPADAEVVLSYLVNADHVPDVWWTEVATDGDFPSSFTLDVYNPPPANLIFPHWLGSPTPVAFAEVFVVQRDAAGKIAATLGALEQHEIVYVPEAVSAESTIGAFYGPLTAGYHLIEESQPPPTADQIATCIAALTGGTCTATDAARVCAIDAAGLCTNGTCTAVGQGTQHEIPAQTPLTITLDGLPCGVL